MSTPRVAQTIKLMGLCVLSLPPFLSNFKEKNVTCVQHLFQAIVPHSSCLSSVVFRVFAKNNIWGGLCCSQQAGKQCWNGLVVYFIRPWGNVACWLWYIPCCLLQFVMVVYKVRERYIFSHDSCAADCARTRRHAFQSQTHTVTVVFVFRVHRANKCQDRKSVV